MSDACHEQPDRDDARYEILAFYRFVEMAGCAAFAPVLKAAMLERDVMGTVLLADEGINGTISGLPGAVGEVMEIIRERPGLGGLECRVSHAPGHVFNRAKVKVKPSLINLGEEIDPAAGAGVYVDPGAWNGLISDPDVVVIDTRNDYEVHAGSFRGAVDPGIKRFRDLPGFVEGNLDPRRHRKVAMFCTGGIRCEKSTAWLLQRGFEEVYHLRGGILGYLEEVPAEESLWEGDCYVFDERVGVDHGLRPSDRAKFCPGCGHALTTKLRCAPAYVPGRRCPRCPVGGDGGV
ncbi:MAG: rhodanese-related sulfurtransferase [Phycisphaerales bacterium]